MKVKIVERAIPKIMIANKYCPLSRAIKNNSTRAIKKSPMIVKMIPSVFMLLG